MKISIQTPQESSCSRMLVKTEGIGSSSLYTSFFLKRQVVPQRRNLNKVRLCRQIASPRPSSSRYLEKTVKVLATKCGSGKSCLMFMFRSRRSNLGRRLWKARVRSRHETGGKIKDWETLYRSGLLKEAQLELLVNAVETRDTSECVLLPRSGQVQEPHFLCCQIWRWPDLKSPTDLKSIPASCKNSDNEMYICCNPYHWSRLCKPESPPPPYCRFSRERLKPEDRAPSEGNCCGGDTTQLELRGSLATNGEGEWCSDEWCRLAYWELSRRVGRQYGVERPSIDVFWNEPRGDGLCLAALAMHSFSPQQQQQQGSPLSQHGGYSCGGGNNNGSPPPPSPPDAVRRAREKIGRGVTLCLEPDGVWAYNRSESPIFVHSPSLDSELSADSLSGTSQSCLLVQRVPPGHCLNVFVRRDSPPLCCDCCMTSSTTRVTSPRTTISTPAGPVDPNSVRISFVKGWGPKYSRQEVTACPTWLEVLLAPCR
ncbi:hypothetical protein LSTR_LSTR013770 [Laodelphax striatellus]|uniref:Mothers against decapentaplegic homolog n=1 Tax=Laodelphax striatellus TaxID=195883 RepID=A0A482WVF1_LAOST|nr:hypothetical protein LSTR_LSTR013770 [Laodelphax striatellus]